jgi:ankyrin repeat protein
MKIKFIFGYCALLALSSQLTFCSDESFDFIEMTDAPHVPDPIFAIIESRNAKQLKKYLAKNPDAINARTPHEDDDIRPCASVHGKRPCAMITDGELPFHRAIALKDIACMQVLVDHLKTTHSTQNNIAAYHDKIAISLITSEKLATKVASFIKSKELPEDYTIEKHGISTYHNEHRQFASLALLYLNHKDTAHNAIFKDILSVSTQAEKDESLYDGLKLLDENRHTKDRIQYEHWSDTLIKSGANSNYKNRCGHTILHEVVTHDFAHPVFANTLITKYDADVHTKYGQNDNTLIHEAVINGSWTDLKSYAVRILLDHGLSINAKNNKQETPAHLAFYYGNVYTGAVLAKAGADLTCKDAYGKTPFDYCQKNNKKKSVSSLFDCTDLVNDEFNDKKIAKQETDLMASIQKIHNKQLHAKELHAKAVLSKFVQNKCKPRYRKEKS